MPKVSVIILTKNRLELFKKALASVETQSFANYEIVVVNDGSTDGTEAFLEERKKTLESLVIINHPASQGITKSRQEALGRASGEYVAFLDDDDEWVHTQKLNMQVEYLDQHPDAVLVGGGIEVNFKSRIPNDKQAQDNNSAIVRFRPESDTAIRNTMLLRNNFFTSTVVVKKQAVLEVGGFMVDGQDFVEDYDLWLRLGEKGRMYNFQEAFTRYTKPPYNKEKFVKYLQKQLKLIARHKHSYPHYWLARCMLWIRIHFDF